MAKKRNNRREKYPNLWKYANSVDLGPGPGKPLDVDMELVQLEEMLEELENQQEEAKAKQQEQQANEAAKAELRERIAQVQAETATYAPKVSSAIPSLSTNVEETQDNSLTSRQKEIANCLADGLNDRKIADKLVITEGTARKHRQNIAGRWGCTETIEIMQMEAQKRGYGKGKSNTL